MSIHLHFDGDTILCSVDQLKQLERGIQSIMAKLDDVLKGQADIKAAAIKSFNEMQAIRAALDDLKAKQANQDQLIAAAVAAQADMDKAQFATQLDQLVAGNAEIQAKMQALDDLVPDATTTLPPDPTTNPPNPTP